MAKVKKRLHKGLKLLHKGFKRSQAEWEESIAGHIGRAVDRIPIIDALLYGAAAYYGHVAAEKLGGKFPDTLAGSATAMIGLRLATSMNEAAGIAGVATLASVGLAGSGAVADIQKAVGDFSKNLTDFWTHITGGGWTKESDRQKRYEALVAECSAKYGGPEQMDQFVACVNAAQKAVWG
jgi:hypothetical protein